MVGPLCSECGKPQSGIVEFRSIHERVTFHCSHCGATVEVIEVPTPYALATQRASRVVQDIAANGTARFCGLG
jgi:hypothetical protein